MAFDDKIERVLRLYPHDCRPTAVAALAKTGGFSGARLWRLDTPRGPLCLRRWPPGHPDVERLEFIQAVLWHVDQEGFHEIALPLETQHHHGYVFFDGHLWELGRWLSGAADYRQRPSPVRLANALVALARFHCAAATFPLPEPGPLVSPGIVERQERLRDLLAGRIEPLRNASHNGAWPELAARGQQLIHLFSSAAPLVSDLLESASALQVSLQPCIRDIWHAHVLYRGEEVSGIVDFGSMRPENVAADVARLLGSLAGDAVADWDRGLAAYTRVRPLSDDELRLITAFDRSTVLMGGLQWLEWLYLEERVFDDPAGVLARVDEFVARLGQLSRGSGGISFA
ncbi:MAG: phosphotransferase enzyme family protein [Pirellulales bacterium]